MLNTDKREKTGREGGITWKNESCSKKEKNLHWLAPDLKGKIADIEISISEGLSNRALSGKIELLLIKIKVNKHPERRCSLQTTFERQYTALCCELHFVNSQKKRKRKLKEITEEILDWKEKKSIFLIVWCNKSWLVRVCIMMHQSCCSNDELYLGVILV